MLRKVLRLSLVLACALLFSVPAYANVVGTWDIDAIVNEKVTVKKIGSPTSTTSFLSTPALPPMQSVFR